MQQCVKMTLWIPDPHQMSSPVVFIIDIFPKVFCGFKIIFCFFYLIFYFCFLSSGTETVCGIGGVVIGTQQACSASS
jgi:hypothetical protein